MDLRRVQREVGTAQDGDALLNILERATEAGRTSRHHVLEQATKRLVGRTTDGDQGGGGSGDDEGLHRSTKDAHTEELRSAPRRHADDGRAREGLRILNGRSSSDEQHLVDGGGVGGDGSDDVNTGADPARVSPDRRRGEGTTGARKQGQGGGGAREYARSGPNIHQSSPVTRDGQERAREAGHNQSTDTSAQLPPPSPTHDDHRTGDVCHVQSKKEFDQSMADLELQPCHPLMAGSVRDIRVGRFSSSSDEPRADLSEQQASPNQGTATSRSEEGRGQAGVGWQSTVEEARAIAVVSAPSSSSWSNAGDTDGDGGIEGHPRRPSSSWRRAAEDQWENGANSNAPYTRLLDEEFGLVSSVGHDSKLSSAHIGGAESAVSSPSPSPGGDADMGFSLALPAIARALAAITLQVEHLAAEKAAETATGSERGSPSAPSLIIDGYHSAALAAPPSLHQRTMVSGVVATVATAVTGSENKDRELRAFGLNNLCRAVLGVVTSHAVDIIPGEALSGLVTATRVRTQHRATGPAGRVHLFDAFISHVRRLASTLGEEVVDSGRVVATVFAPCFESMISSAVRRGSGNCSDAERLRRKVSSLLESVSNGSGSTPSTTSRFSQAITISTVAAVDLAPAHRGGGGNGSGKPAERGRLSKMVANADHSMDLEHGCQTGKQERTSSTAGEAIGSGGRPRGAEQKQAQPRQTNPADTQHSYPKKRIPSSPDSNKNIQAGVDGERPARHPTATRIPNRTRTADASEAYTASAQTETDDDVALLNIGRGGRTGGGGQWGSSSATAGSGVILGGGGGRAGRKMQGIIDLSAFGNMGGFSTSGNGDLPEFEVSWPGFLYFAPWLELSPFQAA